MATKIGNLAEIELDNFGPFPAGRYRMQACKIGEARENQAGSGAYVPVEFEVVEGEAEGRKIFENFSYWHDNTQTVSIALQRTKQWIMATGGDGDIDLDTDILAALEGKEFDAEVTIKPDKSTGVPRNHIRYFVVPDGNEPPKPAPKPAPRPTESQANKPAAAGPAKKKPWEK